MLEYSRQIRRIDRPHDWALPRSGNAMPVYLLCLFMKFLLTWCHPTLALTTSRLYSEVTATPFSLLGLAFCVSYASSFALWIAQKLLFGGEADETTRDTPIGNAGYAEGKRMV